MQPLPLGTFISSLMIPNNAYAAFPSKVEKSLFFIMQVEGGGEEGGVRELEEGTVSTSVIEVDIDCFE